MDLLVRSMATRSWPSDRYAVLRRGKRWRSATPKWREGQRAWEPRRSYRAAVSRRLADRRPQPPRRGWSRVPRLWRERPAGQGLPAQRRLWPASCRLASSPWTGPATRAKCCGSGQGSHAKWLRPSLSKCTQAGSNVSKSWPSTRRRPRNRRSSRNPPHRSGVGPSRIAQSNTQ